MSNVVFSVFTPTWNRIDSLKLVYECLSRQSFLDFEWIIVDDGSTDDTRAIVESWINDNVLFPIKLIVQENSGKHIAQNKAVEIAKGLLFLPLDSDDTIVDNALEVLYEAWMSIPEQERESFSGIGVHCKDLSGNLIGTKWPNGRIVSNDLEIVFKYHVKGEKWGPIRTDIMRKYKNAEVKGHFLSESTVWFRIAKHYKKLYIDEALRYYVIHEDSVQKHESFVDYANAESKITSSIIFINEFWDWFLKYDIKFGIFQVLSGVKASVENNNSIVIGKTAYIHKVNPLLSKIIVVFSSPYYLVFNLFLKNRCENQK